LPFGLPIKRASLCRSESGPAVQSRHGHPLAAAKNPPLEKFFSKTRNRPPVKFSISPKQKIDPPLILMFQGTGTRISAGVGKINANNWF
jgi:hypothetical protein